MTDHLGLLLLLGRLGSAVRAWAMPSASTTFLARFTPAFRGAFSPSADAGAAPASGAAGTGAGWVSLVSSLIGYFFATAFFLPAMVRRGPFFVRALVRVRCPRTGSPFRCRTPR